MDLRPLLRNEDKKLDKPKWRAPTYKGQPEKEQFIRGFGCVVDRDLGGNTYFGGGSHVFNAHGVIKFTSANPVIVISSDNFFEISCNFRQFFSFDEKISKFEIGVTRKSLKTSNKVLNLESLLHGFLNIHVSTVFSKPSDQPTIPHYEKGPKCVTGLLGDIGSNLGVALIQASTPLNKNIVIKDWWIQVGRPIVFLEFDKKDKIDFPNNAIKLDCSDNDIDVYKYILNGSGIFCCIVKRKNNKMARAKSRSLRIINSDLYCYIQGAYNFYNSLNKERIDPIQGTEWAQRISTYGSELNKKLASAIFLCEKRKIINNKFDKTVIFDPAMMIQIGDAIQDWKARTPPLFQKILKKFLMKIKFGYGPASVEVGVSAD
jgi:hypothetical protein